MRQIVFLSIALVAFAFVPAAAAVGPSLPALDGGTGISAASGATRYVARLGKHSTRLERVVGGRAAGTAILPGRWGIQLATLDGALSGLSTNGRVLVLSDYVQGGGNLRHRSRFAVVDTRTLGVTATIVLRGDYSVDALSPSGDSLYLIHHLSLANAAKYQVQAYDLNAGRLLPGVIADKSQAGWKMAGYPVTRATSAGGRWVYTLYRQNTNYPFIHALDTLHHTAVCIGLPANWTTDQGWISNARLHLANGMLEVTTQGGQARFRLNTRTFRLSKP